MPTKHRTDFRAPSHTAKNLFLLFLVFFIGFSLQAILNLSVSNFISELDKKIRNADVQNIIGQDIILDIHKMESHFFQMAAFPNSHMRRILIDEIYQTQTHIQTSLTLLNQGGHYEHHYNLNLPNTPDLNETLVYEPDELNRYHFIKAEIAPMFAMINQQLVQIDSLLLEIDRYRKIEPANMGDILTDYKLTIKQLAPTFHRLKENANQVFYRSKLDHQKIEIYVQSQKQMYYFIQSVLTAMVILLGVLGFWRLSKNITQTTQQVQINQDYTQDILDSQSNIIVVNDGGKRIIDVSGGFFSFFADYPNLEDFANDYDCICDLFVKETGYIYKFEDTNWVKYLVEHQGMTHKVKLAYRGKITTFQISANESKKYGRYIISMFDITENENINAALQTEKNNALSATKAKGEFLANMSHEIRTPLNAILGFINLLKDKNLDLESKRYLDIVDTSGHSLLSIINDILDFSKIESGKFELDPIDFEPRKEFTNIADLFRARCSEKNILFTLWLDPQLPRGSSGLNGDILRIKQVISNLLSNAIKFTEPKKAIELRIAYDPVQQQLTCHVIDEGLGISLENQQRVFEAFSQAESSTTRKFGGTGLGLSISSKLINLLGGQLQLVSELGKGSDFYFSLPAKTIELAHISVPANVQATDTLAFTGHILLVEDNKTNQLLMSAILKRQGLSFDIANDGLEALDCLQTDHDYALVLMDENMPNLNGIEATKQIRAYEHLHNLPAVPIIALTANAMTGDRERFITAGMNEYLTKPINIPALVDVFRQFLKTH